MRNSNLFFVAGAVALSATACCSQCGETEQRPNVIYILADDLGYGDLSCMGQTKFETPNIDRLASQGMLFTQHYAGCSVSAPSRSSLLTGQDTGHTPIRGNKELGAEGQHPIPANTPNVMHIFKENGYATATVGKWGLGAPGTEGIPSKQGVDYFFGYNCQRWAHHYYPYYLWENDEKYYLEGNEGQNEGDYAPYIIHEKAKQFIKDNKNNPFFIYYASILPHAELRLPDEEIEPFKGKFTPLKSYEGVDGGEGYRQGAYGSAEDAHAAFAAMITVLDKQVGDIMDLLDELGIADNTIVIFTSDNGPHKEGGADPEYFNSNGDLRGTKRDLYEGGIRVPFIAKWPGKIAEGSTSDHISAFWDFMPTVADILDVEITTPINGISYLPSMLGKCCEQEQHAYMYWEFHEAGGRQAVRVGDWKGVIYNINKGGKMQLYNLKDDISERNNVAKQNPEIVAQLEAIIASARTESDVFKFASSTFNGDVKKK